MIVFSKKELQIMEILAEALGVPSVQELAQGKHKKPYSLLQASHSIQSIMRCRRILAHQSKMKNEVKRKMLNMPILAILQDFYHEFSQAMTEIARYYGFRLLSIAPIFPTPNPLQTA